MKLIVLKAFYGLGKWWKKGDIIRTDCYTCAQSLIQQGKAKKYEAL